MIIKRVLFSLCRSGKEVIDKILNYKKSNKNSVFLKKICKDTRNMCNYTIPIIDEYGDNNFIGSLHVYPDQFKRPELSKFILVFLDPESEDLLKMEFKMNNRPNVIECRNIVNNNLQEYKGVKIEKYPIDEFKKDLVITIQSFINYVNVSSFDFIKNDQKLQQEIINSINDEIDFVKRL